MRNSHGEGRSSQAAPRTETTTTNVDVMGKWAVDTKTAPLYSDPVRPSVAAQCYNCHTTATPLWRKDDEGKTVCNAYVTTIIKSLFSFKSDSFVQLWSLLQAPRLCSPDLHEIRRHPEAFEARCSSRWSRRCPRGHAICKPRCQPPNLSRSRGFSYPRPRFDHADVV